MKNRLKSILSRDARWNVFLITLVSLPSYVILLMAEGRGVKLIVYAKSYTNLRIQLDITIIILLVFIGIMAWPVILSIVIFVIIWIALKEL